MIPSRLNYLHRGDASISASHLDLLPPSGIIPRRELRRLLEPCPCAGLREVLGNYGRPGAKAVDIDSLRKDFEQTVEARALFGRLKCRGFSYSAWSDVDLYGEELRGDINLRVALLPEPDLFYPNRLRRYLRRGNSNHFRGGAFESIAFAFAVVKDRTCQVLVLQSDLARRQPSYVREHFRGWRKILFLIVASLARERVDKVCLFRASDVALSCDHRFVPTSTQILAWETIYDRTAADFGLHLVELDCPCDLQIYAGQPRIHPRLAYVGDIDTVLGRYSQDHE